MKQRISQIIRDMRQQPLVATVTFIATVLSIFLFMVVVITTRVKVVPFAPESCRDRLLVGQYIHIADPGNGNYGSSGGMSYATARKLYGGLKGVEHTSYFQSLQTQSACGEDGKYFNVYTRPTDSEFFKIFDHKLIAGRYYTAAEAASDLPVAVVSERTARKAFGTVDCTGREISLNHKRYRVVGVVSDHSFLAATACGDVFLACGSDENQDMFGDTSVALLVAEGTDFGEIRRQVKARYAELATEIKSEGWTPVYHEQPYDQETIALGQQGSNVTPEPSGDSRLRIFFYAILLIVPAINLSSLLHSRMQRRVSEIGVRRAYGCTRGRIIADIIWENFLITLAGGLVGVALGVIFAMTYSDLYANMDNYGQTLAPALSAVINWGTVAMAIGVCFILNIISASIPAWQASRLNPVEAINKK